jgi:hypothetical protein
MMWDTSWLGTMILGHVIFYVVLAAAVLYPLGRIMNRVGLSPFWSVLVLIPVANLVALWVFAFTEWPREKGGSSANRTASTSPRPVT